MSKKRFILPLTAFALLLSLGLSACNNNNGGDGKGSGEQQTSQDAGGSQQQSGAPAKEEKITVTAEKKSLMYGETTQLTAKVGEAVLEGVTWESGKPEIATVSATGLVTAVGKGSASIKAKKDGYKDGSVSITCDYPSITVTAADSKTSLLIGETVNLTASEQGVTWTSSDATIAEVANGVVTAKKIGSATIKASKERFNDGSITINVVRPAPTATLHMEDADHYSSDGVWGTSYSGTMYGPGDESPVYARSSGNASDGTCIAYMDNGDQEILTFTSSAAVKAELVMTMASRSAVSDMSSVMTVKLNDVAIDLAGKAFEGGGDTNTFVEFSFGDVNLVAGNNVLKFDFLASSPYMDDLNIYAESATTIAVVQPAAKPDVVVNETSLTIQEGKTAAITSSLTGLSYKSNKTSIATVDENGVVTGVSAGETTISISKEGYKTIKLPVTVTEAAGVIAVSINAGTSENDAVTFRTSQNLSEPYNYIVDAWPEGATLTIAINNEGSAGAFKMFMRARASGGYNSSTTDDLATCMEVKVNGTAVAATGTVSGNSFTDYLLGEVNLTAGANTITIKCLTAVPTMNMLRFIPKA